MKKTTKQIHFNFTGKRFIVSGASSGIGRQIAKELGEAGATVLGLARRENELQRLQSENLERIHIAACDICDQGAVNEVISSFSAKNGKIHGCVHAAGFILPTPLNGYDATAAHTLMETHFWAGINLLKCCTRTKVAERDFFCFVFFC